MALFNQHVPHNINGWAGKVISVYREEGSHRAEIRSVSKAVAEADWPPQLLVDKTILHLLHYKSGAKEGTLIAPGDEDKVH